MPARQGAHANGPSPRAGEALSKRKAQPSGAEPMPQTDERVNAGAATPLLHWSAAFLPELDRIGGGTDARVYRAFTRLGCEARALKIARHNVDAEALVREARVLEQLQGHPHIVKYFGAFTAGDSAPAHARGNSAIALELCAETLQSFLVRQNGRRLTDTLFQRLAPQLLEAARFMHGKGVIHRDIKPANALVTNDHEGGIRLVLSDFGRARDLAMARGTRICRKRVCTDAGVSLSREFPLTPGVCTVVYSAPEITLGPRWDGRLVPDDVAFGGRPEAQAQSEAPAIAYGAAVDIWSLGAVFFEMLSGSRFAQGSERSDIVNAIRARIGLPSSIETPHGPVAHAHGRVSVTLEEVIEQRPCPAWPDVRKMLSWASEQRPAAAEILRSSWALAPRPPTSPEDPKRYAYVTKHKHIYVFREPPHCCCLRLWALRLPLDAVFSNLLRSVAQTCDDQPLRLVTIGRWEVCAGWKQLSYKITNQQVPMSHMSCNDLMAVSLERQRCRRLVEYLCIRKSIGLSGICA